MNIVEGAKEIIDNSQYKEDLMSLLSLSSQWFEKFGLKQTDIQQTILVNHLNEMIKRSVSGEKIPEVDAEMFSEVSEEALKISEEIVNQLGNLPMDEKYVLSIHFETPKNN